MSDIRSVLINPITPNRAARRFRLGRDLPARTDGLGGWQEVARPRRESLTEYVGHGVGKLDLPLMLDGFPHTSVQADLDWLDDLGRRAGNQSPVFKVTGPVYLSGNLFVMASAPDFGAFERRMSDGALVRQEITLHCWKYIAADVTISSSPAKKHAGSSSSGSHPKTYTVRSGDTLLTIAAKVYHDAAKWHQIASANRLRDPNYLKAGQVLKLP